MKLVVLDAWAATDAATVNSHWIAEATARSQPGSQYDAVHSRAEIETVLRSVRDSVGVAYFGHGSVDALLGPHPTFDRLLDDQNAHLLGPGWVHAFACCSGLTLGAVAVSKGVGFYAGCSTQIAVDFDAEALDPNIRQRLHDLVVTTTRQLCNGERSEKKLRAAVSAACDRLFDLLIEQNVSLNLFVLGQALVDGLVCHGASLVPDD